MEILVLYSCVCLNKVALIVDDFCYSPQLIIPVKICEYCSEMLMVKKKKNAVNAFEGGCRVNAFHSLYSQFLLFTSLWCLDCVSRATKALCSKTVDPEASVRCLRLFSLSLCLFLIIFVNCTTRV